MTDPVDLTVHRDDELVSAFVLVRDLKSERATKFKEANAKLEKQLDRLQGELLRRQNERGIDQIKVAGVGTAFRSTKMVAQCADWDVFFTWCAEQISATERWNADPTNELKRNPTDVFAFFQKRLTIDTVKAYMELHEGSVPPAVNAMTEYAVSVRRSTK